jgi:hypothetical protein
MDLIDARKDDFPLNEITTGGEVDLRPIKEYIENLKQKSPEEAVDTIMKEVDLFIPDKDEIFSQAEEIYSHRISSFIPTVVFGNHHDRPIGVYETPQEIMNFKKHRHYRMYLLIIDNTLLCYLWENYIKDNIPSESFIRFFKKTQLYKDTIPTLEEGISSLYSGKCISSVKTLLPLVEGTLRIFMKSKGIDVTKKSKTEKGFELKSLGGMLYDSNLPSHINQKFLDFMRIFYIEKEGENIRNLSLHEMLESKRYHESLILRILFTIAFFHLME